MLTLITIWIHYAHEIDDRFINDKRLINKMRLTGLLLIALSMLTPLYWYSSLVPDYPFGALLSQYIGSVALISMAFSQLLATRASGLESIFGPLDKIYILHKWLGVIAITTVLFHDTLDAEIDGLGRETWLVDLAETLGEFSLYGLLVLVVFSIATFIPYQLWRLSHKFVGALFALSSFHFIFMLKPQALSDPLGLYVSAFCALGICCYLITLLPFNLYSGRYRYQVSNIEASGGVTNILLTAKAKKMRHKAGQFCFVSIQQDSLNEPHPFTLSLGPQSEGELRLSIKALGDYTTVLSNKLTLGSTVNVSKAYGHFSPVPGSASEIWIASGVGITPFAAWLSDSKITQREVKVTIFYAARSREQAPLIDELEAAVAKHSNINLCFIDSSIRGRLTSTEVLASTADIKNTRVYFCGPKAQRQSLQHELNQAGLKHAKFHFEEFEIRAGIGIRKILKKFISAYQRFR